MAQYVKEDCEQGFVTDNVDIEFLKFNNMRHTVLGCMLGDFDVEGNYYLAPELVQELISMPKYIVDTVDNIEVCSSVIKLDKQITFFVTYEGERTTLSLAEKVNFQGNFRANAGLFSNINEYTLDSVISSGVVDRNVVYNKWNISPFSGSALDVFDMDEETLSKYFNLVNRFKYLMKANQILLEHEGELEEAEAGYAVEMMEILSRYPKLKAAVDAQIKEVVEKQPPLVRIDKPNFSKSINEIITQTIEANMNVLEDEEKQAFETERHNATNNLNIKMREIVEVGDKPLTDERERVQATVSRINTHDIEQRQDIGVVASDYVEARKAAEAQIGQRAVRLAAGQADEQTNVSRLLGAVANAAGQSVSTIVGNLSGPETTAAAADATNNLISRTTDRVAETSASAEQSNAANSSTKASTTKAASGKKPTKTVTKKSNTAKTAGGKGAKQTGATKGATTTASGNTKSRVTSTYVYIPGQTGANNGGNGQQADNQNNQQQAAQTPEVSQDDILSVLSKNDVDGFLEGDRTETAQVRRESVSETRSRSPIEQPNVVADESNSHELDFGN